MTTTMEMPLTELLGDELRHIGASPDEWKIPEKTSGTDWCECLTATKGKIEVSVCRTDIEDIGVSISWTVKHGWLEASHKDLSRAVQAHIFALFSLGDVESEAEYLEIISSVQDALPLWTERCCEPMGGAR